MAEKSLDLARIKSQCRIDADLNLEDDLLVFYGRAAWLKLQDDTDSIVWPSAGDWTAANPGSDIVNPGDVTDLVINEKLELAMLLLVGHWFANREATNQLTIKNIPLGYQCLIHGSRQLGV